MSTRAPRPRTIPGEDPQPRDPSEVQRELLEDAAQTFSGKPPFLEYIDGLGQAEIECREVWIYRLRADGSKERQPGKTRAYLEICPLPVDSASSTLLAQFSLLLLAGPPTRRGYRSFHASMQPAAVLCYTGRAAVGGLTALRALKDNTRHEIQYRVIYPGCHPQPGLQHALL